MLSALFFVEYATITDGMVNVLSGGITRVGRPGFPARLELQLIGFLHPTASDTPHSIKFTLTNADSEDQTPIAEVGADNYTVTVVGDADIRAVSAPLVVDLRGVVVPRPGTYKMQSRVNDKESLAIYLQVVPND